MKNKLNKFWLSLAVLSAVAFSSFSMADDMKKDTKMSPETIAKIKAYYDLKTPDKWKETGIVEYNEEFNTFRGLIQTVYKDSKKVQLYIVPLNLSLKKGTVEKEDKVEPEVEDVKKVEEVK